MALTGQCMINGQQCRIPVSGWDSGFLYRASMIYYPDTDTLRVWYSGGSFLGWRIIWHIGHTGGYDCNYTLSSNYSILKGLITVTNGSLTIENYMLE